MDNYLKKLNTLKQNTKYLLRFTNATTNNNWCSMKIDWYEHVNKLA